MTDEKAFIAELLDPQTQDAAFARLVRQYQRPLYAHIRGMVLNHDDTDDVLQNTFVKVFRHLPQFKGESKLFSWMYRIATNEAITFLNNKAKKHRQTTAEYQEKQVQKLQSDDYFDGDQLALKLQNAVATLPEKQQLVFRMKYYEDLKYEEISEITETSVGALKASYFHAVRKIEEYMNRH